MLLHAGCVQQILDAEINAATIRVLTRHGCEVVIAKGAGCCGALPLHIGRARDGQALAQQTSAAWSAELTTGVDAIVVNASGCGTTVMDYGHLLGSAEANRIAALTRDVSEILDTLDLKTGQAKPYRVAYHDACSLQHGQRVTAPPRRILNKAFLLRLGRDLQFVAARHRAGAGPTQGRACREHRSGHHRGGQSRLHGTDRPLHATAGAAHGLADRLGDRRTTAREVARKSAEGAAEQTGRAGNTCKHEPGAACKRRRLLVRRGSYERSRRVLHRGRESSRRRQRQSFGRDHPPLWRAHDARQRQAPRRRDLSGVDARRAGGGAARQQTQDAALSCLDPVRTSVWARARRRAKARSCSISASK